jgi:hypothetical protein
MPETITYSAPSYGLIDLDVEAPRDRITLPKVTSNNGPATTRFK